MLQRIKLKKFYQNYNLKRRKRKSNYPAIRKFLIVFFVLAVLGSAGMVYELYARVYQPNIVLPNNTEQYIYIPTNADFFDVVRVLSENGLLINANFRRINSLQKSNHSLINPNIRITKLFT